MATFCAHFDLRHCRSCGWIEHAYDSQLAAKEAKLRESLGLGPEFQLEPAVASPPTGFRNRAKMTVTGTLEHPVIGLIGESDLDQGRELLDCPIHHPRLNELISALPAWIREFRLEPYRIAERRGELKGIIAFHSPRSRETYLRFVLRSRECVARIRKLLPALQSRFSEVVCVSVNLQPVPHAILEGPEEILLTERRHIELPVGPVTLQLAPQAFVQTNLEVAEKLYAAAASWIGEVRPARMLELYCGQGAFSFFAAGSAERLLGIEINPDAVRAANETAARLGLSHLRFQAADATRVSSEIASFRPELILANPPRRGLATGAELLLEHRPEHFLYSSCNVETLAHDLRALAPAYRIHRAQVFDMFPHTEHFEALVWLQLRRA